jgi:hypothetical protein
VGEEAQAKMFKSDPAWPVTAVPPAIDGNLKIFEVVIIAVSLVN